MMLFFKGALAIGVGLAMCCAEPGPVQAATFKPVQIHTGSSDLIKVGRRKSRKHRRAVIGAIIGGAIIGGAIANSRHRRGGRYYYYDDDDYYYDRPRRYRNRYRRGGRDCSGGRYDCNGFLNEK